MVLCGVMVFSVVVGYLEFVYGVVWFYGVLCGVMVLCNVMVCLVL